MNDNITKSFRCGVFSVLILSLVVLGLYFWNFHNGFDLDIMHWAAFSTFISDIIMVLLTALNIWIFYKLTLSIGNNNSEMEQQKINDRQRQFLFYIKTSLVSKFFKALYSVFTPNYENSYCEVNMSKFVECKDTFEQLKDFSNVFTIFSSQEYSKFISDYWNFCLLAHNLIESAPSSNKIEQDAYKIFMKGKEIINLLNKDLANEVVKI